MQELHTSVDIAATPEQVWDVLADFGAYPAWNPLIPRITGELTVGVRLDLDLQLPGRRPVRFRPVVTEAREARLFAWRGTLGIPGLFDGHHRFELAPTADGGTRLVHAESFRGLLAWPLVRLVRKGTDAGFQSMNQALRERAEAPSGAAA